MAARLLGLPVLGPVHNASWKRPTGNTEFQVTSAFGPRDLNSDGDTLDTNEDHVGIDLGNRRSGDPVVACLGGKLTVARTVDGTLHVDSGDGLVLVYAHLAQPFALAVGAVVRQGQQIGKVGSTGTKAAHLHLERKVNGVHTDPWPWFWPNAAWFSASHLKAALAALGG